MEYHYNDSLRRLFILQVKIGMMHIAEAVNFLHNTANLIHRNITPGSIYITKKVDFHIVFDFLYFEG